MIILNVKTTTRDVTSRVIADSGMVPRSGRHWYRDRNFGGEPANVALRMADDVETYRVDAIRITGFDFEYNRALDGAYARVKRSPPRAIPVTVQGPKVVACDFKDPLLFCQMYGGLLRPFTRQWAGFVFDESASVDWKWPTPKPDYSKMVLRIGPLGKSRLYLPMTIAARRGSSEGGAYCLSEVAKLASWLREHKVRELTLRRYGGAGMDKMTDWLRALVNEHCPVMKITSDPEPLK